jgi:hypothetical protein
MHGASSVLDFDTAKHGYTFNDESLGGLRRVRLEVASLVLIGAKNSRALQRD